MSVSVMNNGKKREGYLSGNVQVLLLGEGEGGRGVNRAQRPGRRGGGGVS